MNRNTVYKITALLHLLLFGAGGTYAQVEITQAPAYESLEKWVDYTKTLERRPYRNGATGPYAFDCSGFTQFCYKQLGIELSRTSALQAKDGKKIRKRKRLKTGDLVCFNGSKIGRTVGHVGIVVENNNGVFTFIHASSSVGVTISRSDTKYYDDRYVTGRRITDNKKLRRALKKYVQTTASEAESETTLEEDIPTTERKSRKDGNRQRKSKEEQKRAKETGKKTTDSKSTERQQSNGSANNGQEQKQDGNKRNAKETVENAFKNNTAKGDSTKTKPAVNGNQTVKKDTTQAEPAKANDTNTLKGDTHKVQKGDTLYNIAKRAGCTVQQLRDWNNLTSDALSIGQELRVR